MHLAPGLTDLIELAARSSVLDQSVDEGASFCADDASLPGSAMKRAPRSATKARPPSVASATTITATSKTRAPRARSARARRPSYAEDDLESDLEEESESESSAASSESENDDHSETEGLIGEDVRNTAMSPTKQFVLSSTGKTKKVTPSKKKKSAAVKKISFQDDEE